MDCQRNNCDECPERFLCHCLAVTEEVVTASIARFALATIEDIRRHTGAGEGCTSCHARIRAILEAQLAYAPSASPDICSVR